jgi:tetratricopeptide (TPR) repeat protein
VLAVGLCASAALDALAAEEEDSGYRALWKRGAYRQALERLDEQLASTLPNAPMSWVSDRAELRFLNGEVDLAIEDLESLVEALPVAHITLRLAEVYRYRGRMADYEQALDAADRRIDAAYRYAPEQTLVVAGRLAELRGEDPKRILSTTYKLLMDSHPDYVPAYVAAGDLAHRKGSYAAAAQYYLQALERDANEQEALAGLAACYWASRDERLEATLETLTKLNPHQPEGVAVRVEMLLDAGKTHEALEHIDAVLKTNPNQLHFRALKAAALFLEDDDTGMAELQAAVLAFNPQCSDVFRVPGRIASRHYRFKESVKLQRRAVEIDPADHVARAELAFNLLRLGEDEAGRGELEAAFAADPYNVAVFNSLNVLDTLAEYELVSEGPFMLQLPAAEAPVLTASALDLLTQASAELQRKYDLTIETPVRVQIFDNHDDFMVRSLGLPGNPGHLGICFGQLITMDSPSARPKGSMNWHAVLWHEFTHVITLQKTKNRMPRWLSEGISVYEETLRNPGWGMRLKVTHQDLIGEELPGASDLELFFTQPKTPEHLMLGYFLSAEFVTHYVSAHGEPALVETLDRIGRNEKALSALAVSAGVSVGQLDQAFRAYLERRFEILDRIPEFAAMMRRGLEASATESWSEAEQAFQEAHTLLPEYHDDDGPLARLAEIYETTGQKDALVRNLQAQMELNTENLSAWRRLTTLYKDRSDWPKVAAAAEGGAAIDPFDLGQARDLLEAQRAMGAHEEALATATRLVVLDSARAPEYQVSRVELLMALRRWPEAKRQVIALLEESPHYWEAQKLLLALVEGASYVR